MSIELHVLDYWVIFLYVVILVGAGLWVGLRSKGAKDQFTAGRSLGWFNIGLSLFGTNIGPQFLIAMCGGAYLFGLSVAGIEWYAWIPILLLGFIFVPFYLRTGVSTMPQFLEMRYGPKVRSLLAWFALCSIVVLWLSIQLLVGGKLLAPILDIGLAQSFLILLFISTVFTVVGGLKAVVVTDAMQSILIIIGAGLISYLGVQEIGGIQNLWESSSSTGNHHLSKEYLSFFRAGDDAAFPWYAFVFGFPVLGLYYWCTDQTIVQRTLGASSLHQAQKGVLFAGFLKIIPPVLFVLPGLCWRLRREQLAESGVPLPDIEPDEVFLDMVATLLGPGLVGLIVAIMAAMLISSVDSGINSFSTIASHDIYKNKLRPDADEASLRRVGRWCMILASVLAFGTALVLDRFEDNLFVLIQKLIGAFAPPIAALFVMGVAWNKTTPFAALLALGVGGLVSVVCAVLMLVGYPRFDFWPHHFLVALYLFLGICGLMIVVSLADQKHPAKPATIPSIKQLLIENRPLRSIQRLSMLLVLAMAGIFLAAGLLPAFLDR